MAKAKPENDREPPSAEWTQERVEETVEELALFYGDRKKDDKERRDYFRGTEIVETKRKGDPDLIVDPMVVQSGRYQEWIILLTGMLATQTQYGIDAYGVGEGPERRAEKAERWLNTAPLVMERQQGESTNQHITQEVLIYGFTGRKDLPDPKLYAGRPLKGETADSDYLKAVKDYDEKDAPLPIVSYHIPTMTWYPLLSGKKVLLSVERKSVPYAWIRARYPKAVIDLPGARRDTALVDFVEIVSNTHCGYFMFSGEGEDKIRLPLRFWDHGIRLPDRSAPVTCYEGVTTSDSDLRYKWRGILDSQQSLMALENMLMSRRASMVRAFWQPTVILESMATWSPQTHTKDKRDRKFKFGATNIVYRGADGSEGDRYSLFENPTQLPDAEILQELLSERFNAKVPLVLQGRGPAGDSGYKTNLDTEAAAQPYDPIADNLATGDVDSAIHWFYAVKAVGEMMGESDHTVYVRETVEKGSKPIGISHSDVEGYDPLVSGDRRKNLVIDWAAKADVAEKYLREPINAPYKWVVQNILRVENPVEWEDDWWAERLEKSAKIQAQDEALMEQQLGILNDEAEGMPPEELQALLAAGGQLPPALVPQLEQDGMLPPPQPQDVQPGPEPVGSVPPPMEAAPAAAPRRRGGGGGSRAGQSRKPAQRKPRAKPEGSA